MASLSRTVKFIYRGVSGLINPPDNLLCVVKYDVSTGSYGDPNTDGIDLTESPIGASGYSYYTADVEVGTYKLVRSTDAGASWSDIEPFIDLGLTTADVEAHILATDDSLKHDGSEVLYTPASASKWTDGVGVVPDDVAEALDELSNWVYIVRVSGSGTYVAYSPTTSGDWDTVPDNVRDALDELASRLRALEGGTATAPTGIYNRHGKLGIIIGWDAQNVAGIEYKIKWVFKHTSESTPTDSELKNEGRVLTNMHEVLYEQVHADLSVNPYDNVVLYYKVGAKGSADSDFVWSDLQSIEVDFPTYNQLFAGVLNGLSICTSGTSGSVTAIASDYLDSDEVFPTASGETGGLPDDNYIQFRFPENVYIRRITIYADDHPTGDVDIKYYCQTTGASGSFAVSSSDGWGDSGSLSMQLDAGDKLYIWTLDAKDMGHYRIRVEYAIR